VATCFIYLYIFLSQQKHLPISSLRRPSVGSILSLIQKAWYHALALFAMDERGQLMLCYISFASSFIIIIFWCTTDSSSINQISSDKIPLSFLIPILVCLRVAVLHFLYSKYDKFYVTRFSIYSSVNSEESVLIFPNILNQFP
jgi:hypothetical protein